MKNVVLLQRSVNRQLFLYAMLRKFTHIVLFASLVLVLGSCAKNRTCKELQADNDSLMAASEKCEIEVNNYFKVLNEISEELDKVMAAEQLIVSESSKEVMTGDIAQKIKRNIKLMNDALETSKKKVAMLEQQMNKGGSHYSELDKTVQRLTANLQDRSHAVDSLVAVLNSRNQRISDLDKQLSELAKENQQKSQQLKKQTDELNTGWYVLGSSRELQDKKILVKGGVFSSTKVSQNDFNRSYFIKVDIRSTNSIPVYSQKDIKIKTNHPLSSYSIATENGSKVIKIKDTAQFWSISKYLVVELP